MYARLQLSLDSLLQSIGVSGTWLFRSPWQQAILGWDLVVRDEKGRAKDDAECGAEDARLAAGGGESIFPSPTPPLVLVIIYSCDIGQLGL